MKRLRGVRALLGASAALVAVAAAPPAQAGASAAAQRPLRLDDLFRLESLGHYYDGPYAFSPDGQAVAVVRSRPATDSRDFSRQFLWGVGDADIWLQPALGAPLARLTDGAGDDSGWWAPRWSADGRRIAMVSTRGGSVGLWVEDLATHQLRQLSQRNLDLTNIRRLPYLWLDADHLIAQELPEGERPLSLKIDIETPDVATAAWRQQRRGQEVTASVLDSGPQKDPKPRPHGRLVEYDAGSGAARVLADEDTRLWAPAPGGGAIAYVRQVDAYKPRAGEPLQLSENSGTYVAVVAGMDGQALLDSGAVSRDVVPESLRWSADGGRLAFLAYDGSRAKAPKLYVAELAARRIAEWSLGQVDAAPVVRSSAQLEWCADGSLLVLGAERAGAAPLAVSARRDWWKVASDTAPRNLSAGLAKAPPQELWATAGHRAFVGAADGALWRIAADGADGASAAPLDARLPGKVGRIAWPQLDPPAGDSPSADPHADYDELLVTVGDGDAARLFRVALRDGATAEIARPEKDATLAAYDVPHRALLFARSGERGLAVWRGGTPAPLFSANEFLREVRPGQFRRVDYTSEDGEALWAWLLLPPGYKPGARLPMLTWVYAGSVNKPVPPRYDSIGTYSSLNMQLAAAHGYAVLFPSMPLAPEGETDDPMLRLTNGVMPAVQAAIDQGVADPDKLYLMGQSFGGFSTYGLVTQTHRFRAAVALAGLSDLISLYGQFDARFRYGSEPQDDIFMEWLFESAQTRMGGPPWQDLGRYLRNSPLLTVDRVQTPLLIIQGDLDYVAMQQGEEFFRALYRQGKRARFVRYWGEDHVLTSPANIRDMWTQIFGWLDSGGA